MRRICLVSLALLLWSSFSFAKAAVVLGIDQAFKAPYWQLLAGKRIGLVVNNASRNSQGERDIDVFYANKQLQLRRIFTPEHGLAVSMDAAGVSHDPRTGVPVSSLYQPKHRLSANQFKDLDVLVFDLQDVGLRYYTYTALLGKVLELASSSHIPVMVLDRVNPLGGEIVSGARLDKYNVGNITTYFDVPTRYGLTTGELASYANATQHLQAKLVVVPLQHWQRRWLFNQTGLNWVAPSPRLVTFEQAYLYAIFGVMEATNISVGIGQATPHEFHYYGAPYISRAQAETLVARLQAAKLPGLSFHYQEWTSQGMKFEGQLCRGVAVTITDYATIQDFFSLITLLKIFHQVLGPRFVMNDGTDTMLGHAWVRRAILQDVPMQQIVDRAKAENQAYLQKRQAFFLYD